MTLAELTCVCNQNVQKDILMWNHTSSIMALTANVNSAKGKSFEPAKFNPYSKMNLGKSRKADPKKLLEQFKNF